jgi:MFS family permease
MRRTFIIAGIVAFFAIIPLKFVSEGKRKGGVQSLRISLKALPKSFRLYTLIATIFALGNFTYMFFILRAQECLSVEPTESITIVLLLYIWFNIVYTIFSIPSGMLSDKIGRKSVLIAGYSVFGFTCVGFASSPSSLLLIILFALYGLFNALVEATQRAFASDFVPEELRGTALGTFHTTVGLATLPASVIAGLIWQYISPSATFLYGAGMGFLAAMLFVILGFKRGHTTA